jgi:hypothetical protein
MEQKSFLKRIIDSKDTASSRRFITLVISAHFVIASFAVLFLICYMAVTLPKGRVDNNLLLVLEKILEYDFYIILAGFGIITSEGLLSILLKRKGSTTEIQPTDQPFDQYIPPPGPPVMNPDGTYSSH